jgi:hypothetical protein
MQNGRSGDGPRNVGRHERSVSVPSTRGGPPQVSQPAQHTAPLELHPPSRIAGRLEELAASPAAVRAGPLARLSEMKTGTSTGGIETSARYRRKQAKRRKAEEAAWTASNGPVLLRIGEHEIYVKSQAKRDVQAARDLLLKAIAAGVPPGVVRPRP